MLPNRFDTTFSESDDFKREQLIKNIERALAQMKLGELEALSYDMFTKGYLDL